jgi:hypothetical protein
MERVLETTSPIVLHVSPDWEELNRLGLISNRFLPGTTEPCLFLEQNSVVRVSQIPAFTGGPDLRVAPLRVILSFPDGEMSDQPYAIHRHVGVPEFKGYLAALLGTTLPIVLTVSPDWEELDHQGAISARVFPGSSIACPYITQDSEIRVRRLSSMSPDDGIGESSSVLPPDVRSPKRLRPSCQLERREGIRTGESDGLDLDGVIRVSPAEKRELRANFKREARLARSQFKEQLVQEWVVAYPSMGDKENLRHDQDSSSHAQFDNDDYAYDHFVSVRMEAHDRWAAERKAIFVRSLTTLRTPTEDQTSHAAMLRQNLTKALWEGLRRVFFGEIEGEPTLEDGHPPGTHISTQEDNRVLLEEIAALMDRLRLRPGTRSSPEPSFPSNRFHDSDSDDPNPGELGEAPPRRCPEAAIPSGRTAVPSSQLSQTAASSQSPSKGGSSSTQRQSRRIRNLKDISLPRKAHVDDAPTTVTRRRVQDRYFYEPVPSQVSFLEDEVSGTNQKALLA